MSKLERYYQTIPNIYNPRNNRMNGALIQAWAQEDEAINTQAINANEQLFVATGVNGYLTNLGLNVDVPRPLYVALSDIYYRDLIYAVSYAPKQVKKTMYDVLDVFWGPTYSRANVNSNSAQNYNFGGDFGLTGTLTFTENGNTVTGAATLFTTELSVGDYIKITGQDNTTFNKVLNIINDTTLVIEDKFLDSTIVTTARGYTPKVLSVKIDNDPQIDLVVIPKYISNLASATAEEVSNALNGNGSNSTASSVRKDLTTNRYVNLRTNTTGSFGQIQVTGGTANAILNFPTTLNTIDTLQFNTVIYEINPREIVLKIPRLVAKLTRTLKGAWHINNSLTGDIFALNDPLKLMNLNLSKMVGVGENEGQRFGLDLAEATVTLNTAGQNIVIYSFSSGDDLTRFPQGVNKINFVDATGNNVFNHNYIVQYLNFAISSIYGFYLNDTQYSMVATDSDNATVDLGSIPHTGYFIWSRPDNNFTKSTPATVWNISHFLNTKYTVATVYDGSDNFLPINNTSVIYQALTTSTFSVTFSSPQSGHVSFSKPNYLHTQSVSSDTWNIKHNLGTQDIIPTFYNSSDRVIPFRDIFIIDDDNIQVRFYSAVSGHAAIIRSKVAKGRFINNKYFNSYIYNPKASFFPSRQRTILKSEITAGTNPVKITVDDASHIPNEPGHLIFNFGRNNEEVLVPYIGRPNNSTITLDASYIFANNHILNEIINFIPVAQGYDPKDDGSDYATYITGTKKAVEVVQDIIKRIKAVGVVLRWIIKYPEYNFNCCDDC